MSREESDSVFVCEMTDLEDPSFANLRNSTLSRVGGGGSHLARPMAILPGPDSGSNGLAQSSRLSLIIGIICRLTHMKRMLCPTLYHEVADVDYRKLEHVFLNLVAKFSGLSGQLEPLL